MAIVRSGGNIVSKDGKLGTGNGCCCGGPCNPSTCPNGTECAPPCVCVDGQCAPSGCCCVNGVQAPEHTTKAACEQCEEVNTCTEYQPQDCNYVPQDCTYADQDENGQCPEGFTQTPWGSCEQCDPCPEGYTPDPFFGGCTQCDPCPEGWTPDGFGGCSRVTTVGNCEACQGTCEYVETLGPCGSFAADCQQAGCTYDCCYCDKPCDAQQYLECIKRGGVPQQSLTGCWPNPCASNNCCPATQCDEECEWPDQITLTLGGVPDGYMYRYQNGGSGMPVPPGIGNDVVFRVVGTNAGIACTAVFAFPENGAIVLDKVPGTGTCNGAQWIGWLEYETGNQCSGGGPSYATEGDAVVVTLSRQPYAGTTLAIQTPPGGFGGGATAVVTSFNSATGAITGVQLCSGGAGYAQFVGGVVQVSTPTVTVLSTTGGQGAVIVADVDDDPNSPTFGKVVSLTIQNGGTGYGVGGWSLTFAVGGSFPLFPRAGAILAPADGALCAGQNLTAQQQPGSALVGKAKCGSDLLNKTYDAVMQTTIFPSAVDSANGVNWSLSGNNCNKLWIVGATCQISS